ncbi:hypothetical protein GGE45_003573 [Rhizobium aethiopicum]|uniref:Primase C-terminal 2 domain-containing protein n=1 Tax=Rhizobium aethiopicum TaxID=1138170 RepID=A0A7W6QAN3_9HYPH|nr:DUF3987 domain-containing protein [Rhizobium aethiopicum]MBB4194050.1 hypothetical protein [Rhizobium aethiopicum]MBB4581229.1 hypothetical protein [Rhizobium aethiopicum]
MLGEYSNSGASRQSDASFAAQYRARQGALSLSKLSGALARPEQEVETPKADTTELTADPNEMQRFVHAVFKRCVGDDRKPFGGRLALRAFTNEKGNAPVLTEWEPLAGKPVASAVEAATRVARRPADQAAVFAPPVCVFNEHGKASEADVLAGPAIIVDLDGNPTSGRQTLEAVLGPATLVVASGGIWTAPDGSPEPKLHLYWRLTSPAVTNEEKALLRTVRKQAAELAGGDATAAALCHPMRWPGSWHTKGAPNMCSIVGGDEQREVRLADAAKALDVDTAASRERGDRQVGQSFTTRTEWTEAQLMDVAEKLPNTDLDWDDFNSTGMAFYDAAHGSSHGYEAFRTFSAKSAKHDDAETEARWEHYKSSPPDRISGTWLIDRVRKFADPMYVLPHPELSEVEKQELRDLFHSGSDDTIAPQDIFGHDAPTRLRTPPDGCLPPMLARLVRSEARRKGASEAFTAAAALATIGSAIGASLRIQVRDRDTTWTEPAALWCVLVADPGSAKSPVISTALKPLKALDGEWLAVDRPKHAAWTQAAKRAARKGEPIPQEPPLRRAFVDDVTAEKQVGIHADNPRGIMRSTDELAGMLETFGAYKKSGGGDRSMMLRLFDGDSVTVDRVTTGNLFAKHALMGVLAGSQPDKLRPLVKDLQTDGLLQRFLFVLDDGARVPRIDEEEDEEAAANYRALIRHLATAEYVFPQPVKLSPAARTLFKAFMDQVIALQDLTGASSAWKGHTSKWEKIAARFMLIFHVIEQFGVFEGAQPELPIEGDTANRALAFCRFMLRHSLAFYTQYFDPDPSHKEAIGLAGYLLTRPDIAEIKRRDIANARTSLKGGENLRRLLHATMALEEAGWLVVKERAADGPTAWRVNPQIHERFAKRAELERTERARKHESIIQAAEARRKLLEGGE